MPPLGDSHLDHGIVNPTDLWSSFPTGYDSNCYEQQAFEYSEMENNLPTDFLPQTILDPNSHPRWNDAPVHYSLTPIWHGENSISTSNTHDDRSGSSASNSPSPASSSTHPNQSEKRRAQNRAAQRAYRDRKTRHLHDLRAGISNIESKMESLQTENTDLIRRLCEIRAANNDLRDARRKDSSTWSESDGIAAMAAEQLRMDGSVRAWGEAKLKGSAAGEELYEPFAAMWNLIHLDPSVVRGTVSPRMVLERLQAMVEFSAASVGVRSPGSSSPREGAG